MRTTVSVDDDVLLAVKERARREHRSVGAVLSDLTRQALTHSPIPDERRTESFDGFEPFPHRGPMVTNELINLLREDDAE